MEQKILWIQGIWNMNWGQFKECLCYLRLIGCVVTPCSFTQEIADSPFNYKKGIQQ